MKHEWKKAEKKYYLPGRKPKLIIISSFRFFSIEGKGDPNNKFFAEYIGVLYENKYMIESKRHREIYLSDARKVIPDKLKTVLRFKILLP